jgi:hypothetical protein
MGYGSSIAKKKCKGECGRYPVLGLNGWCYKCVPEDIKERVGTKRDVAKRNKAARNRTTSLLSKDNEADKSKLLSLADKLFGDFIKLRDSNEQGVIICVGCGLPFHLKDKCGDGSAMVNVLHYVVRSVYSLRFSELNAACGCAMCNFQMHLFPDGEAGINYRNRLINTIGEMKVIQMEEKRRVINKLSVEDLKEVIQKYSPKIKTDA